MDVKSCVKFSVDRGYTILKSSTSHKAFEIFANICELVIQRGCIDGITAEFNHNGTSVGQSASINGRNYPSVPNTIPLRSQLKNMAFSGYPVMIKFLLLLPLDVCFGDLMSDTTHVPAYLLEQLVVQFIPKRLVVHTISDFDKILSDMKSHWEASVINELIRGCDNSVTVSNLKALRFVCRLTNLWKVDSFLSCWLDFKTSDLIDKDEEFTSLGCNISLIRDFSNFTDSIGTSMGNRPQIPKKKCFCLCSCSGTHPSTTKYACKTLSRIFVTAQEALDATVTSVREFPSTSPNGFDQHNLENCIPTNKSTNGRAKLELPKSPVVMMSQWAKKPTSFFDSLSPLPIQSKAPQVDERTDQLTGLRVQHLHDNVNSVSDKTSPLVHRVKYSKSFTESTARHYSNTTTCSTLKYSPTPAKQKKSSHFDFNESIARLPTEKTTMNRSATTARPSCLPLKYRLSRRGRSISASAATESASCGGKFAPGTPLPSTSSHQLLINFEESMLNGRIPPSGVVEGFSLDVGASGSFFPPHVRLPVVAHFFQLTDDGNTPSPYLGRVDLTGLSNGRGYHVPHRGSIQLTLFNPSNSVMKVFVIQYNLEDMPANSQTFLRQRTVYMPVSGDEEGEMSKIPSDLVSCVLNGSVCSPKPRNSGLHTASLPVFPRYLVHLRFHTTKSCNLYLHTDIRLIFARGNFEFDPLVATYRMKAILDTPSNPRFSSKAAS